jgi:hypothetical protein
MRLEEFLACFALSPKTKRPPFTTGGFAFFSPEA